MHNGKPNNDTLVRTDAIALLEQEVLELRRQLRVLSTRISEGEPKSREESELYYEARYRALLELSPQIVWSTGPDGITSYVNQQWYDLTGLSVEETLLGKWTMVVHPDDRERVTAKWQQAVKTGKSFACEFRFRASDGQYRWYYSHGVPMADANGNIAKWMGIAVDIHERKMASERLAEADDRLRLAAQAANIGTWDHYLNTDKVEWSPRTQEILGYGGEEHPGFEWFFSRIHPEDRARMADRLKLAKDPKVRAEYDADYRFTRPDGTSRWILARGKCFFDGEGPNAKPMRTAGIVVDITDRRQAEWERTMLTAALQHSPDFIGITDLQGKIVFLNKAGQKLVGLHDDEESKSKYFYELLLAPELKVFQEEILPTIHAGRVWEGRFSLKHLVSGAGIPFDTRAFGIFDSAGQLTNIATVSRDIAEKEKLEEQLRTAQKMEVVGQLAAGVAHDFNNLLTVVRGSAEVLEARLPADAEDLLARVREINSAADRATALTEQLLAFGRRQMVLPQAVNFNHVVHGLADVLRKLVGEKISLALSLDENLWNVKVNPSQADQILINLATNARDAMPRGGTIRIKTWNQSFTNAISMPVSLEAGNYVCLSFSDDGCGMDPVILTHIFEPFFTTKGTGKGNGMGLATIYGIVVQQCDGQITVHSAPNEGAEFTIYFPRAKEAPEVTPVQQETDPNAVTILIAEDEPGLLAMLAEHVREKGFEVLEASNAEEALAVARNRKIDLLVSDIVMPGGSGQDLATKLGASHPDIAVIFMSGYADDGAIREALGHPKYVTFVQKPFTLRLMMQKIREVLGGKALPAAEQTNRSAT